MRCSLPYFVLFRIYILILQQSEKEVICVSGKQILKTVLVVLSAILVAAKTVGETMYESED
jgi:hypothetical protein